MNMPSLSPTMTQGNITKWRKQPGEQVSPGQIVAEVETDKATIEWEAQEEGFMAKHLVPEGARDIPLGAPVAVLADEEDAVAAFKDFQLGAAATVTAASAPTPAPPPAPPAPAGRSFPPHQLLNMPALSPTMSQGNIVEWKKKVGDSVAPGDVYCEVETDKATISWESQEEGYIAKIMFPDGSKDISIGAPVLVLVEDKGAISAFASFTPGVAPAAPAPAPAQPAAAPAPSAKPPSATAASVSVAEGGRVKASPYARKLAAVKGLGLESMAGSGPGGRIVAADVQGASAAPTAAPSAKSAAPPAAPAAAAALGATYADIPHSQIRRVTAARLLESKQTIPHYYLTMECQMDALMKLREQMNSGLGNSKDKAGPASKISVNDFVVKAAAKALKQVPGVNASWTADYIRMYKNVDISIAVQTPVGLQVPIVKDADLKSIGAISTDVKTLAGKAKDGKLHPSEFMGGTFTISNLGMFGIKHFAAIVNPPQSAILAVGGAEKKVVRDAASGGYKEVSVMLVTLSCDHRVIDGAMGAEWLQAFRACIENPLMALL